MRNAVLFSVAYVALVGPAFGGISLGTAETFAVLGASTVTNTGATKIKGNLGVSPGTAVVGFPPGKVLIGAIYAGDAYAAKAQADLTTAYNSLAGMPCGTNLTGQDLGGLTLTPGVYCFNSSAQLTGPLVLDFLGSTTGTFVFQIGSTLTTASSSTVSYTNCTKHCAVYWQVGSSATLGTGTKFTGNILALASITLTTNVEILCGRALALTGAVTMDTNEVFFMGSLTPPPAYMTGRGQIQVPKPNSAQPDATGAGEASFAFVGNAPAKGTFFDYLNYVTGVHVYGLINDIEVIATHPDGSPRAVQFTGTCHSSLPQCFFSGTLEKSAEQGGADQFGVTVTGRLAEARSLRMTSTAQTAIY